STSPSVNCSARVAFAYSSKGTGSMVRHARCDSRRPGDKMPAPARAWRRGETRAMRAEAPDAPADPPARAGAATAHVRQIRLVYLVALLMWAAIFVLLVVV